MSSNLPPNWSWVKLGDVSNRIHYGYTASAENKNVGPKLLRITDIQEGKVDWAQVPYCTISSNEIQKYLLSENDIVFARTGATVGKSFLIKGNIPTSVFASYLIRLQLSDKTLPKFIFHFFQSNHYWSQIKSSSAGIGQPNVNAQKLSNLEIPLPPLPEQKKIVEKIEELFSGLDSGVASLKKAKAQIRLYRQTVLASAFCGQLVSYQSNDDVKELILDIKADKENHYKKECLKAKNEGKHKPNRIIYPEMIVNYPLYGLPKNWEWGTIFMTSNYDGNAIVDGPFGSNLKTSDYDTEGKIPVITISNIEEGFKNLRYINEIKYEEVKRSTVYPGDIIVAKIGSSYGKVGYYPISMVKGIIPANLLKISVSERFNKQYLFYYLKSYYFKKHLDLITKYTAQPAFNVSKFKALPIPIPSRTEQDLIVEEIEKRFSEADNLEKAIDESLAKSETLRHSILKQAFEGKLI